MTIPVVGFDLSVVRHAGPPSWSDNTMRYNISQDDGTAQDGGASINVSAANAGQSMSGIAIYNNTLSDDNGTSSAVMSFAGTPRHQPHWHYREQYFLFG